jgi:hypothetical protein
MNLKSLRVLFLFLAPGIPALISAAPSADLSYEDPVQPRVRVPIYPNVSCPIMGKPISTRLTVDTDMGRFWVCCKGCDEDILRFVEDAHRTAYPVVKRLANETCPVSGKPIPQEDQTRLVLQGFDFAVCCAACIPAARADSQVILARLNEPGLIDLGNRTCPVSGDAVDLRAFVVIDKTIVRLAHARSVAQVEKEPDKVLAAARKLRAEELEREREEAERKKPIDAPQDAALGVGGARDGQ